MQRFFQEILLHSSLHHPHLVEMIGASWEPPNLCLVLAYCEGGDLKGLLENAFDKLKWQSHKLRMMREIAQAMAYLHTRHPPVMHRDLKTANVLVDLGMKMKISDFGESKAYSEKDHDMTMVGTNFYIAPEVFRGDNHYDMKADVFGVGMIMLAMTVKNGSLRNFFVDNMGMKVKINANHASVKFNEGYRPDLLGHNGRITGQLDLSEDEKLREPLAKFIGTLISPDCNERPNMNEVVKSMDNLERWICIRPPEWATTLDDRIKLGVVVFHPERGRGSVVSFDGFERVHVLYEIGSDLYRRYSEEGWIAKMSIGEEVTNENVLGVSRKSSSNAGRRPSAGGFKRRPSGNKVGAEPPPNSGDPKRKGSGGYSYANDAQSMGIMSWQSSNPMKEVEEPPTQSGRTSGNTGLQPDKFMQRMNEAREAQSNGDKGSVELSPAEIRQRRLSTIKSFDHAESSSGGTGRVDTGAVEESFTEDKDLEKRGSMGDSTISMGDSTIMKNSPSVVGGEKPREYRGSTGIMGMDRKKGTVPGSVGIGIGGDGMVPPGGRQKRRRSSLMALAADPNFDPTAAVSGVLSTSVAMSSMQTDAAKAAALYASGTVAGVGAGAAGAGTGAALGKLVES
jgi:serine/threonine protein kinase